MLRAFTFLVTVCSCLAGMAQENGQFTMEISSDTVLMDNRIMLRYSIENLEGEFEAPDLADFIVVSGPNVSSQFSSVNGRVSQKSSYSYYIVPRAEGIAHIGSAKLTGRDETITLEGRDIRVLSNPHGVMDQYGRPLNYSKTRGIEQDTMTAAQKILQQKLKKGKRHKI